VALDDRELPPPKRSLAQSVFRDGAFYALAGVLGQGISFLLFPFFAHVFEPRDFGILDLLVVLATLVNLTVALEISQGLGRYFAEARTDGEKRAYVSTAFTFSLGCYGLFCGLVAIFAGPLTDLLLGDTVRTGILRLAAASMFLNGIGYLAMDNLRWQLRPRAYAVATLTTTAVVALSSAVFVLVLDLGVEGAVAGQIAGYGVGAVVAVLAARRLYRLRIDRALLRQMLAYSLPLVPASTGVFLNGYADRVAIQARGSLADVGLYGVGYRLSVVVGLTLMGFQGALLPQLLARHHETETPLDLARVFRLFCALALCVLLAVSTFADEFLRILTRPKYYGAEAVVPYLIGAAFFAGMYIFAPGLNIAKRTKTFAGIAVACGIANLVLAFALVGPFGIEGAALSFLVTEAAAFAGYMHYSQRFYPVPHPWGRLAVGAAVGVALTIIGWKLPAVADDTWALPVKVLVVAAGGLFLTGWMLDADERAMGLRGILGIVRRSYAPAPASPG
jgi:O-antigen/teichoic acid export membrane protein